MKIKIGDTVRFLDSVGGGVVKAFCSGNVVMVETEDGFDVPVYENEVVVITPGSTLVPKAELKLPIKEDPKVETKPKSKPAQPRPTSKAGEKLNIVLAYLPDEINELGKCGYEGYIVNESNYDLHLIYSTEDRDTGERNVLFNGVIPYDSVEYVDSFPVEALAERRRVSCQIIPYKSDTKYGAKPCIDAVVKLDPQRFFKRHAFVPNPYFDEGAITFILMNDDKEAPQFEIRSEDIQAKMNDKIKLDQKTKSKVKPVVDPNAPLVVDLHHHELLDTTVGMEPKDILEYQKKTVVETMEANLKFPGKKIIFIHGKGDGVLRKEVEKIIKSRYDFCSMQDASFQEYGFGATQITIRKEQQQKKR
ncbi:MAG: DUF2027 domain-containing protein [Porphyromonas sp.]|nr:DUF2027 domain-containing protein [Porphyromonas sp.]